MKRCGSVVAALAVLVSQSACYTTRVVTGVRPEGPPYSDRQWFTLGGLAAMSEPTGRQCRHGVSYAESKLSGTDWLIDVGLGLAGGLVGAAACARSQDALQQSYCASAGALLVPFLISSRTVEYACAEGSGSSRERDYLPPRQGYGPPPRQGGYGLPPRQGYEAPPPPPPQGEFHPASPPSSP